MSFDLSPEQGEVTTHLSRKGEPVMDKEKGGRMAVSIVSFVREEGKRGQFEQADRETTEGKKIDKRRDVFLSSFPPDEGKKRKGTAGAVLPTTLDRGGSGGGCGVGLVLNKQKKERRFITPNFDGSGYPSFGGCRGKKKTKGRGGLERPAGLRKKKA